MMLLLTRLGIIDTGLFNPAIRPFVAENEVFLYMTGALVFVEIMINKSENLREYYDTISFIARPISAGFVMYCFVILEDPILNFASAVALGIIFTLPFANLKDSAKMLSRALALRRYNFYLSLTEDLGAIIGSFFAIIFPYLSISLIPLGFLLTIHRFKHWKEKLLALKQYPMPVVSESNPFDRKVAEPNKESAV
jgi:hypothetical protein